MEMPTEIIIGEMPMVSKMVTIIVVMPMEI